MLTEEGIPYWAEERGECFRTHPKWVGGRRESARMEM